VRLRSCCVAAVLLLALPAVAQDRGAGLRTAFSRAQHLRHGINASLWFAQVEDYSAARTNRFNDAADIALMARMGFDNVRLCVDPAPLEQQPLGPEGMNADFLLRLDRAVDTMLADGLSVQLSMFPDEGYKAQLNDTDEAVNRLAALWRRLAAHYATRDPERMFFEILNEPEVFSTRRWTRIQEQLAAAIRESAPRNTIIATGPGYSNVDDLEDMHPLADGNVIYTFHFYEPHLFTHQGATWAEPLFRSTHGIPYPASAGPTPEILAEAPDWVGWLEIRYYWWVHWDAAHIRSLIDGAAAWSHKNNVPVISNEFGVYREHVDAVSRTNWLRDVRAALEADGIGWTVWDYCSGFGVVWKQDNKPAKVDAQVVAALGMKWP